MYEKVKAKFNDKKVFTTYYIIYNLINYDLDLNILQVNTELKATDRPVVLYYTHDRTLTDDKLPNNLDYGDYGIPERHLSQPY